MSPEQHATVSDVIADWATAFLWLLSVVASVAVSIGLPLVTLYVLVRFVKWAWGS